MDEVSAIAVSGHPGRLCVYGPDAFGPVIVGSFHDAPSVRAPVVAAGQWQSGRVVVFSHDGYFRRATLAEGAGRLLANALHWVPIPGSGSRERPNCATAQEHRFYGGGNEPDAARWNGGCRGSRHVGSECARSRSAAGLRARPAASLPRHTGYEYLNPHLTLVDGYAGTRNPVGLHGPTFLNVFDATSPRVNARGRWTWSRQTWMATSTCSTPSRPSPP